MEIPPPTVPCHMVAMPYPAQGHINSLHNFCTLLLSHNPDILVTFVVTEEWLGLIGSEAKPHNFQFCTIPNIVFEKDRVADFHGFIEIVTTKMEALFEQVLHRLDPPPTIIIYDTILFWVVGVGNRSNIPVASFWPMAASQFCVAYYYDLLEQHGDNPINVLEVGDKRVDYFPGISSPRLADFPLTDGSPSSWRLSQWRSKFVSCLPKAQYLLLATANELEPQAIDVLKSEFSLPIYPMGLAIPYANLSSSSSNNHINPSYFQWLDNQPSCSVLYISQGSFFSVSKPQIDEIAAGLRVSGVRFFWVGREETQRLREICGDKGLVLEWCDQLRVLMHSAVGGFWSHCGWNSTQEGVFAGVPFLTFPIAFDQMLNSKMIVEDWKVGWRVKKDVEPQSLVSRDEIARLLQRFMDLENEEGRAMRKKAKELQRICQISIANGGSSETNINAFIKDILPPNHIIRDQPFRVEEIEESQGPTIREKTLAGLYLLEDERQSNQIC